jgi:hypothetical protein
MKIKEVINNNQSEAYHLQERKKDKDKKNYFHNLKILVTNYKIKG